MLMLVVVHSLAKLLTPSAAAYVLHLLPLLLLLVVVDGWLPIMEEGTPLLLMQLLKLTLLLILFAVDPLLTRGHNLEP
jgi:hypothetical protein